MTQMYDIFGVRIIFLYRRSDRINNLEKYKDIRKEIKGKIS